MKKITVFIEDNTKEISLNESIVVNKDSFIYVKTASVFWNYSIVYSGNNDTIIHGSSTVKLEPGYWTFDLIKKKFQSIDSNLTITANQHNNTCTISTDANVQLKRFGELLGFDNDTTINARASKTSKSLDISSDMWYIKISCDAVDRSSNIDNDGKRSAVKISLPITTNDTLKGSVSHYTDIESKISINKGVYNKLTFEKISNNGKRHFGSILLELYIM